MPNDICKSCTIKTLRVHDDPVRPDIKPKSSLLFLIDFPIIEDIDSGIILSGITNRRVRFIHSIMKDAKLNDVHVSYASVLRCITKSKAIITMNNYETCSGHLLRDLEKSNIKMVISFGSVAGSVMTGEKIKSVDHVRGKITDSVIPGIKNMTTYSLSVATDGTGCSSCNFSKLYPSLILKDVISAAKELNMRSIWM
jgi:uracil-DNA glycosylase